MLKEVEHTLGEKDRIVIRKTLVFHKSSFQLIDKKDKYLSLKKFEREQK